MSDETYTGPYLKSQKVEHITLNRPDARNAFDGDGIADIERTFSECAEDDSIVAVRLQGAGPIFCAGADIKYMAAMKQKSPAENRQGSIDLAYMFQAVVQCSQTKPLVVELHGGAYGGATCFLGGDSFVISEVEAKIGLTEVKLGIGPFTVGPSVIHKIGPENFEKLAMTGRIITANEAQELGLVDWVVVNRSEIENEANNVITDILNGHGVRDEPDSNEKPEIIVPLEEEQAERTARYIAENPEIAPNAARKTMKAIWDTFMFMEADGDPYSDRVIQYTADAIAELRVQPEAQQAAEFFSMPKERKQQVAGTKDDPREWMQPAPGA